MIITMVVLVQQTDMYNYKFDVFEVPGRIRNVNQNQNVNVPSIGELAGYIPAVPSDELPFNFTTEGFAPSGCIVMNFGSTS